MNNGLGNYVFSKSWIREHLKVVDSIWHIDYAKHESEQQIRDLFNTTQLPTPFGATIHIDEVVDKLYVSMNRKEWA